MAIDQTCPIWRTWAEIRWSSPEYPTEVDSPRAGGRYRINVSAEAELDGAGADLRARLTTWLVEQRRLGSICPLIRQETVKQAKLRPPLAVQARADRLLELFAKKTQKIGSPVKFGSPSTAAKIYPTHKPSEDDVDAYLWYADTESIDWSELSFLKSYLVKRHWVGQPANNLAILYVTVEGYSRLAELATASVISQAFVAMWFDASMDDAYGDGIEPGIRESGYKSVRLDHKEHNNKIDDEIIAEIRRSRFLVADFTQGKSGARGGVYYEAGFAQGLNIPVIFTCRQDAIDDVHFDTRQYNHIVWTTPAELRTRLSQRISATIGDGPLKITT